jgi:hypothetical protein
MVRGTSGPLTQNGRQKPVGALHSVKDVGGHVKNTIKDIVPVLKGYYEGAEKVDEHTIIGKTLVSIPICSAVMQMKQDRNIAIVRQNERTRAIRPGHS